MRFDFDENLQTFEVPANVETMHVRVDGASGGGFLVGRGAAVTADVTVVPGERLTIVTGARGILGGTSRRAAGGGGPVDPNSQAGSGGGGSFVFADTESRPLVAAGGGGGSSGTGAAGGDAGETGGQGDPPRADPGTAATGGTQDSPGSGGDLHDADGTDLGSGGDGDGPASGVSRLPLGGTGSVYRNDRSTYADERTDGGGGGGGGWYSGGGGGHTGGGGAGSSYVDPTRATDATFGMGDDRDGDVVFSWTKTQPDLTLAASPATGVVAGDQVVLTATVDGVSGPGRGTVAFSDADGTISDCDARAIDENGTAVCTTTLASAGDHHVTAAYSGSFGYLPATTDTPLRLSVGSALSLTTRDLPDGSYGTTYHARLDAAGGSGTYTFARTAGTLPAGLALHADGTLEGTPTAVTPTGAPTTFTVTVTDADGRSVTGNYAIGVTRAPQTVDVTVAPAAPMVGGTYRIPPTSRGGSTRPLQIVGDDNCSVLGRTVSFEHAGRCVITAWQDGDDHYDAAPQIQRTVDVARAPQRIVLTAARSGSVGGTLTISSSGGASGQPVVLVGDGCTVDGVRVHLDAVGTCTVTAQQAGDDDYLAAAPTSIHIAVRAVDPRITATVTGHRRAGWFTGPATVRFTCTPGSASLAGSCPAPVTVAASGVTVVARTIAANDGGRATASATVAVDRVAPTVRIVLGTVPSGTRRLPKASLVVRDDQSGVARTALVRTVRAHVITYRASVTDHAGNSRTARKTVRR
ncbi:Putative Ig domain-containing protein [Jatrophihabitans endophyticus]|uniref:receptor protein-tyrosine kinase n=1 Tax=Jatrophihabitans endophyticus TaxID=1206085 RepID=A0A1M5CUS0_9ACTN|nr:Ig-like domain repeat protein [Jatrophihabitans endophyticus]SHF58508.1 Putative Ig domain-containing protein [Jatrophihabitans endophyticus]